MRGRPAPAARGWLICIARAGLARGGLPGPPPAICTVHDVQSSHEGSTKTLGRIPRSRDQPVSHELWHCSAHFAAMAIVQMKYKASPQEACFIYCRLLCDFLSESLFQLLSRTFSLTLNQITQANVIGEL